MYKRICPNLDKQFFLQQRMFNPEAAFHFF